MPRNKGEKSQRVYAGSRVCKKLFLEQASAENVMEKVQELKKKMQEFLGMDEQVAFVAACKQFNVKASGQTQMFSAFRSIFGRADVRGNTNFLRAFVEIVEKHVPQENIVLTTVKDSEIQKSGLELGTLQS